MSFISALLTAQNIPLIDWSKTRFINNVLWQGDKMYLQALNDGFVVLEPGVELLSIDNLPKLVSVSSCIRTCFLTRYVILWSTQVIYHM
jgi:hypothetical protein